MDYTIGGKEIIWDLRSYVPPVEILAGFLIGPFSSLGLEKVIDDFP